MDPATIAIVTRMLDLAFVGLNMWQRYDESAGDIEMQLGKLAELRRKIEEGHVSKEEIEAETQMVHDTIMAPLNAALSRL